MSSARRPIPPLRATPMYCVTISRQRWLRLGVFTTAHEAQRAADEYSGQHPWLAASKIAIEPIYVSRQVR